jgi:predicted flap endonuclease-1-like 5' DNA nuclease
MVNSLDQVEKNVAASFGYVKKDILMINDSYSRLQEAISQLAKSYGILGDEIKSLKRELETSKKKENKKAVVNKTLKKKEKKDNLTVIEGIGSVIQNILRKNNIKNFKDLSKKSVSELRIILEAAGPRFVMHNPSTWPHQAKLASEGRLDELAKLQKELKGGIRQKTEKKTTKKATKRSPKRVIKETTVYE